MATKQEKVVKSAVTREKKRGIIREERHVLYLLVAIILVLLYLLLAQHYSWWPYSRPKLGTAFYTNVSAQTAMPESSTSTSSDNGSSSSDGNTSSGSNSGTSSNSGSGNSGSSTIGGGSTGGSGTTTTTPSSDDSIADFAAGINVGNTKTSVSGQANNLGEHCAVIVNAHTQTVGKQEVCTYSQGNKIVTVTYLNDRVVSASKTGF
jgi:cytoskeletal protein RodZ